MPIKAPEPVKSETADDAPDVLKANTQRAPRPRRRPGLAESNPAKDERVVPEGKGVICSVGRIKAWSSGFIDCCPSQMLADTRAVASLVDKRVLKRLERASEPLRPYHDSLNSVPDHATRVSGIIDLPVTLGILEKTLSFLVLDHLYIDAILGTDSLEAFRAIINLEEQAMMKERFFR